MNNQSPQRLYAAASQQAEQAPPQNIEAEQALLGAILMNNDALLNVAPFLSSDDFAEPLHQRIFDVCAALVEEGKKATPISLKPFLPEQVADGFPTGVYLAKLAANSAPIIIAVDYARQIVDLAMRRKMIESAQQLIEQAQSPATDLSASALMERHESELFALKGGMGSQTKSISAENAVDQLVRRIQAKFDGTATPAPTTGFQSLDRRLGGGFEPERLIVIGGRPGMAKTVLLLALARKTAKAGSGAAVFSLEIGPVEIGARMVASHYGADVVPMKYADLNACRVSTEDAARVEYARRVFKDYPLEIDHTRGLTVGQIESRARMIADKMKRKGKKLQVVFIDYLQLINMPAKGNRSNDVADAVLHLRNMGQRLGVAVVLLSQLNRQVETREDKRPLMSDLRDAGGIEEHADAVGLLYRPSYYDEKISRLISKGVSLKVEENFQALAFGRRHDLEIIFDKNRLGPPGTDTLFCDVARSLVTEGRPQRDEETDHLDFGTF